MRRVPNPWLHFAYLIVLWFSHALLGRKPVGSICPQLSKILRGTSTICSQARTTARWNPPLLLRQGCEHLSHTCIYHHSTQNLELDHTGASKSSKRASTLCPSPLSLWEKVPCSTSWPWPSLRGQKDTERETRSEQEDLKEGGIGETCLKDRKGKQLAGDADHWSKGMGQSTLVPAPFLHAGTSSVHVSASHLAEVTPGDTWGHLTLPIFPWNIRFEVIKAVILW